MPVKYCKDCKFSVPDRGSSWQLRCKNPYVNSTDNWALGHAEMNGTNCYEERGHGFIKCLFNRARCGEQGRYWEKKDD